jgi:hypothetical protein
MLALKVPMRALLGGNMRKKLVTGALGIVALVGAAACGAAPAAPASSSPSSAGPSPLAAASTPAAVSTTPAAASTTSSAAAGASGPAVAGTGTCAAQVKDWYLRFGSAEISNIRTTVADLLANEKSGPLATTIQLGQSLRSYGEPGGVTAAMPACGDPDHVWATMLASYYQAGTDVFHQEIAASAQPLNRGNASLQVVIGEIATFTPVSD